MPSDLWAVAIAIGAVLLQGVMLWLKQTGDQATGAKLQSGAVAVQAANTEAAIADAQAAAPQTPVAVVDRLKNGTF